MPNPETQAKITQKLALRTLFLVLFVGVLFGAFYYIKDKRGDFNRDSKADTIGTIAAIQFEDSGQRVCLFSADGKLKVDNDYKKGARDQALAWQPDGNKLFFASDRVGKNFNIFRWDTGSQMEQMTTGTRARNNPSFPIDLQGAEAGESALITTGGSVFEFVVKTKATPQVLPPLGKEISTSGDAGSDEHGIDSQFGALYGKLGNSFRAAKWCKNKGFVAAIMRRDQGEVLVAQDLTPVVGKDGETSFKSPTVLQAADHIEMTVDPKTGNLIYSVQGFQWMDELHIPPKYLNKGKVSYPFQNGIMIFDFTAQSVPIILSNDAAVAYGFLAASPDGSKLIVTSGSYDSATGYSPLVLVTMPLQPGGGAVGSVLARGAIFEPSWDPTGELIAFAMRGPDGKRGIYTVSKDGTGQKKVSGDGDFGFPIFSPQVKAN